MTTYLCSCWTWNLRRRRQGLSNTQHMSSLSFLPSESEFTVTVEPSLETDKGTGNISRFSSALRHASHDSVLLCLHFFPLFFHFYTKDICPPLLTCFFCLQPFGEKNPKLSLLESVLPGLQMKQLYWISLSCLQGLRSSCNISGQKP